ncbi:MAG TPA: thiamine phosphate synthase [Gemmatimonadales bacterium]|nr:thiamine phosphate synthase [Gemmatimonadales bacterium]
MRPLPRLLAFTDASIRRGEHTSTAAAAIAAIGPAVGFVARDHDATAAELTDFAALLLAEAHAHEAAIIVAGRPDLAAGLSAHGVQLRAGDLSHSDARRVLRKGWIGRSVHSAVEGSEAVEAGADYLVAGSIWETPTHPGRQPAGLGLIEALVSLGKPVFAIGGVTAERARQVHAAGGYGVAAIRSVWEARRPDHAAAGLVEPWA